MSTKERLHRLVDELPESEVLAAERFLEFLRVNRDAELPSVLRDAPWDDEPETEEERAAVEEAWEDIAAGRVLSHEEVRRQWLDDP